MFSLLLVYAPALGVARATDGDGQVTRLLLDVVDFASVSGLSVIAERPMKTGEMAVVADQPCEQGYIAFYSTVLQVAADDFRIYYHTSGLAGEHSHVATSKSAAGPWVKPKLGLIGWNGTNGTNNTQNNIIYVGRLVAVFMDGAPGVSATARFKAAVGDALTGTSILRSSDGFRWPAGAGGGTSNVGWSKMSDTQPVIFWDAPTRQYMGYGRFDLPSDSTIARPKCTSIPYAGAAAGAGSHRFRMIGVASATDLVPGCFNRTALGLPHIAIDFPAAPVSSCVDLYTSQTVRYEDHFLSFPSAYYHFRDVDPPIAVRHGSQSGVGNDGTLEVWLTTSRNGISFAYLAGGPNSSAFVPRGMGEFDPDLWHFTGEFDAGVGLMTRGWLQHTAAAAIRTAGGGGDASFSDGGNGGARATGGTEKQHAEEAQLQATSSLPFLEGTNQNHTLLGSNEWDTVVMYHRGSQFTHWVEWHSATRASMIRNGSKPGQQHVLSGIARLEIRRDGWAALRMPDDSHSGPAAGTAVSVPVLLPDCANGTKGAVLQLLLNANVPVGDALLVTVLDASMQPVAHGSVQGNGVRMAVQPNNGTGGFLTPLPHLRAASFQFTIQRGSRLYAWELRCQRQ
jgi:hypothetical protein